MVPLIVNILFYNCFNFDLGFFFDFINIGVISLLISESLVSQRSEDDQKIVYFEDEKQKVCHSIKIFKDLRYCKKY